MDYFVTPFTKQCFVILGSAVNYSQVSFVTGFAVCLLQQLNAPDSTIPLDVDSSSWIASIPTFFMLLGNLLNPYIMGKFGRKICTLISIIIALLGWICIMVSNNLALLVIGRILQGISTGFSNILTPVVIGEYSSPKRRGAFSMVTSVTVIVSTLIIHALGSYMIWKTTALVCIFITIIDLLVVALSPETPSWLADHGKYEECQKVFRWLRGDEEEDELAKLIEASKISAQIRCNGTMTLRRRVEVIISTSAKKEFYKPIIIMIHVYIMSRWSGLYHMGAYSADLAIAATGDYFDVPTVVMTMDTVGILMSILAIYIIRKVPRRLMLFSVLGLNAAMLLVCAGYEYLRQHNLLPFHHPVIAQVLLQIWAASIVAGALPFPVTIAGEIFPLRYRSLAGGMSALLASINAFLALKTYPFLVRNIGSPGTYCVYAGIMTYSLVVVWFMLPETKDRTLQDIEDEFKGKVSDDDLKSAVPLKGMNGVDQDNVSS